MDGGHHVFYLGTCAKVLFPSLRVAYVVVPRKYLREFSTTVSYLGRQPPLHVQAALCDFITGGYFHAHIRRMRRLYERRQSILVQALQHGLEGHVAVEKPAGGMQLVLRLPARFSAGRVCAEATARGLLALDIERYCVRCDVPNALFLGFAAVPEAEMDVAAAKLSDAIIASAQVVP